MDALEISAINYPVALAPMDRPYSWSIGHHGVLEQGPGLSDASPEHHVFDRLPGSGLTPDNPHLSRVTWAADEARQASAINCSGQASEPVLAYVRQSLAANTRRAYLSDIAHFEAWGGSIPANPHAVASYLAEHAARLSIATLIRRIASVSKAHEARGLPNPTRSELVRATMRGIRRNRGSAQREAKPLLKEDLFLVLAAMGDNLKDVRDRALLLIGFAGGFRRSELVGLDASDIEHVRQGVVITLRRSKTDQDGGGRKIGIPYGRTRWCPVAALDGLALGRWGRSRPDLPPG
jgi:integrase